MKTWIKLGISNISPGKKNYELTYSSLKFCYFIMLTDSLKLLIFILFYAFVHVMRGAQSAGKLCFWQHY